MLLRRLTHVVLLSALATGCSQSLFDDGTGGGDDGTPPDANPDQPPVPDAAEGARPDADMATPGDGGVPPDDGGVPPDAGDDCPVPCINDNAFGDYDGLQGGGHGRWRYIEVQPDGYSDMTPFTFPDAIMGFIGTGDPAPSLAYCPNGTAGAPCADLQQETLALTTTAPGANHPALMWIAPADGLYIVDVTYDTPLNAPDVPATVMLVHNDQANILDSSPLDEGPVLYAEQSVAADDVIVLSIITESETRVSVGVNVVIRGPY